MISSHEMAMFCGHRHSQTHNQPMNIRRSATVIIIQLQLKKQTIELTIATYQTCLSYSEWVATVNIIGDYTHR